MGKAVLNVIRLDSVRQKVRGDTVGSDDRVVSGRYEPIPGTEMRASPRVILWALKKLFVCHV